VVTELAAEACPRLGALMCRHRWSFRIPALAAVVVVAGRGEW